jgi:hypothetical protein
MDAIDPPAARGVLFSFYDRHERDDRQPSTLLDGGDGEQLRV